MFIEKLNIKKLPSKPGPNEIHIYPVDFNKGIEYLKKFETLLNEEEKNKAARFHFRKDRNAFILAHGILRSILANYLDTNPGQIEFQFNEYGKPFLRGNDILNFNISHSKEKLLLAFSTNILLGIDVEFMNTDFANGDIAEKFFSPAEVSMLNKLPGNLKTEGFYNCWTRKEALIKGIGKGLSIPLDSFDVELTPGKTPKIFDLRFDKQEKGKWEIIDLDLFADYKSAIAIKSNTFNIKLFNIEKYCVFLTYS